MNERPLLSQTQLNSPSAGEWEYLSVCGDNGVQSQSIRQRKKIAKRNKIKGNAWTLGLKLNQPSPSLSLDLLFSSAERRVVS